mmetsp:Transcript_64107/g.149293  ORF Transcript_64107/g.149293 Transcript_64107/m.149293 type:complete len:207 (-) Transcript_64107:558-1178(-)
MRGFWLQIPQSAFARPNRHRRLPASIFRDWHGECGAGRRGAVEELVGEGAANSRQKGVVILIELHCGFQGGQVLEEDLRRDMHSALVPTHLVLGEEHVHFLIVTVVHHAQHFLHLRVDITAKVAPIVEILWSEIAPAALPQECNLLNPVAVPLNGAMNQVVLKPLIETPEHLFASHIVDDRQTRATALKNMLELALLIRDTGVLKG